MSGFVCPSSGRSSGLGLWLGSSLWMCSASRNCFCCNSCDSHWHSCRSSKFQNCWLSSTKNSYSITCCNCTFFWWVRPIFWVRLTFHRYFFLKVPFYCFRTTLWSWSPKIFFFPFFKAFIDFISFGYFIYSTLGLWFSIRFFASKDWFSYRGWVLCDSFGLCSHWWDWTLWMSCCQKISKGPLMDSKAVFVLMKLWDIFKSI